MALTISRRSIVGTVASAETGGRNGSILFHWASVTSEGERFQFAGSDMARSFSLVLSG